MASLRGFLFLTLILIVNICKSRGEPNFNISYRTVTVDLNPTSVPQETIAVVKKRDENGVSRSFTKYVLFGTERTEYFNVGGVVLGAEKVLVGDQELRLGYVYDVYTYWKKTQILVVAFRYYYAGASSYYKYYKRLNNTWKEVVGNEFGQNGYGHISTENLTKLLNVVEMENPKPADPEPPKEAPKKESKKTTVIIVSAVVISLLVLMLAGLAFYFFK